MIDAEIRKAAGRLDTNIAGAVTTAGTAASADTSANVPANADGFINFTASTLNAANFI